MALDPVVNFGKVTVSTGYNGTDTTIVVNTGHGTYLPAPGTAGAFNLVWWNTTDYNDPSDDPNKEIVRCTARTTDTLTVTRAQEGTSGSTKNTADKTYKMLLTPTKKMIDDLKVLLEDDDFDTTLTVEETADADTIVGKVATVEVFRISNVGIMDLPKQSRARGIRITTEQVIGDSSNTKVQYNSESYDNQNEFDSTTNYRFTAIKAGYYLIAASVYWHGLTVAKLAQMFIQINGATASQSQKSPGSTHDEIQKCIDVLYLAVNDYVEIVVWQNTGGNLNIYNYGSASYLAVHKLS
jgi:hypothetical protein